MGSEDPKDPLKGVDWKAIGTEMQKDPSAAVKPVVKKRLPKKIREIPECYFLPRRSLPSAIAFYGAFIASGIGAGMLLEVWINKKIKVNYSRFSKIFDDYDSLQVPFRISILQLYTADLSSVSVFAIISEDGGVIWEFDK